jgi:hypothetical protein
MSLPTQPFSVSSPAASQRGFALVIALSLMSFVLLLVLSLSTLIQVENRSASTSGAQLEARLNAQLGAMIALGDLQRYTGPDQRVTARSDILVAPGEIGSAGQERWTGVWSSKSDTADSLDTVDGLNNRQPVWLVSGENPDAFRPLSGTTVALATVGKSVIDKSVNGTDDTVRVETEVILGSGDNVSGRYAYWVSDEGIKARVNLADPHLDSTDPDAEYYRNAMAQVADPTAVSNVEGNQILTATDSRWKNATLDPSTISTLKNIPMFLEPDLGGANLDGVNREFFHDFTVHSSGVLANVKDGGLKRDLSTALLALPPDLLGPMFPPASSESEPGQMDPGGPKWEQLSDYYQLAKANAGSVSDTISLRMPTNEQVGFTPVVTRWNFMVQGFAERNPTAEASGNWCLNSDPSTPLGSDVADWAGGTWLQANGYRYSLGMFPLITLWNPYDRDMVIGDLGLEIELPAISVVDSPGSSNVVAELLSPVWHGDEIWRWTIKFVIRGVTLRAGEAVNFSPPSNSYFDRDNPTNNVLVPRGGGDYVNGFFTAPVASTSAVDFFEGTSSPSYTWNWGSLSKLSLNFSSNGSLWNQLIMLYSSTDLVSNQFPKEGRFKLISFPGTGKFTAGAYNQLRIILNNRLAGNESNGLFNEHLKLADPNNINYVHNPSNPNIIYANPFILPSGQSNGIGDPREGTSYFDDFVGPLGDSKVAIHMGSVDIIEGPLLQHNLLSRRNPFGCFAVMKFPEVPYFANREIASHIFRNMNPTAPVIHHEPNVTHNNQGLMETPLYTRGKIARWVDSTREEYYNENIKAGTEWDYGFVGLSNTATEGSRKFILYEVPDELPVSLGQLSHVNLMNYDVMSSGEDIPAIGNRMADNGSKWHSHTLQLYATPSYAIGNSGANPLLRLNETKRLEQFNRLGAFMQAGHYDYSYELNDVLWDEFFFSGIKDLGEAVTFPLPNSRLTLSDDSSTNLTLENRAAADLLLQGAFNVNSTSVAAWEAVLGAMRDIETMGVNPVEDDLRHNFSRFTTPLLDTPGEEPNLSSKDELAAGFRNLSDAQIAALAQEIVNQVRLRSATADANGQKYPFLSLSNFINRSTDTSSLAFALNGPLQAAIDAAEINGVATVASKDGLWSSAAKYPLYLESSGDNGVLDRPLVEGMPGFLMQSDILNKLGTVLQARSDTFSIRSYGSSQDALGGAESSRAYYEVVVQRTPDYLDDSDADYAQRLSNARPTSTLADATKSFPRVG